MKLFSISLFVICLFLSEKCISQPGTLDKTFGTNGITVNDFYKSHDFGTMAMQPDNKILVGGSSADASNRIYVYRYDKNGLLDTSFGNKGKVFLSFDSHADLKSIDMQSDEKIVLGGIHKGVFLERLNHDGSIDSSFGLNGMVQYDSVKYDALLSLKIQKDGKIVTAGQGKSPLYPVANVFTLHRFNTDGSIDSTFGTNGDIYMHLADGNDAANDLVIQKDGKIVAGGFINVFVENFQHAYITLIRFNVDGSVDNSFGNNGVDTVFIKSPYDFGVSLALQQDQKILVSHFSNKNGGISFALLRFGKNGGLDSSFANNGIALTNLSGNDNAYSVCVDSSANIYQAGTAGADFGLVKFKSSGTLDSSFGNNGKVVTHISNDDDFASSVKIQSGSKILVGGCTQTDSGYHLLMARYNNDVILPVALLNYTAKKQNNKTVLQWQTTNEINNNYFDIERSADSKAFAAIGKVYGLNGINTNNYSFTDNATLPGTNYYRLKQVDDDGKFVYSNVVSVQFSSNTSRFVISPNPATNNVNINIPAGDVVSKIIFYDATARKVIDENVPANVSFKQFDVSSLPAGNYTVVLIQDSRREAVKFIKLTR